jgi:hypothetical protein
VRARTAALAGVLLLAVAACQPLDAAPAPRERRLAEPRVLVAGDSIGWTAGWAVEPVGGVELHVAAGLGCGLDPAPILVGDRVHDEAGLPVPCEEHEAMWVRRAAEVDPDVVVFVLGAWEVYDRVLADDTRLVVGTPAWERWIDDGLERAGAAIAAAAPHAVIVVTDVPCMDERGEVLGGAASPRNDEVRRAVVSARLRAFADRHPQRVRLLEWSRWLCGPGAVPRPDGVHFTPDSARAFWAGALGEAIRALRPA